MLAATGLVWLGSMAIRPARPGAWIGRWAPGIGDPTVLGWATVVLYAAAVWLSFRVVRTKGPAMARAERLLWQAMAVGLLLLGINKQLDMQAALREAGRILAFDEGWYGERHAVQRAFILALGVAAAALGGYLLFATRQMPRATIVAALGACALMAFVVVRAAFFHHVGASFGTRWGGARGNWLAEVGGLLIILVGARQRLRTRAGWPASEPASVVVPTGGSAR